MAELSAVTSAADDNELVIWLPGKTAEDLRLVERIKQAFVDELNERFKAEAWPICKSVLETGAAVAEFLNRKTKELEDREDAAV